MKSFIRLTDFTKDELLEILYVQTQYLANLQMILTAFRLQNVIDSKFFVGYEFKKDLLKVQQAILVYCMNNI